MGSSITKELGLELPNKHPFEKQMTFVEYIIEHLMPGEYYIVDLEYDSDIDNDTTNEENNTDIDLDLINIPMLNNNNNNNNCNNDNDEKIEMLDENSEQSDSSSDGNNLAMKENDEIDSEGNELELPFVRRNTEEISVELLMLFCGFDNHFGMINDNKFDRNNTFMVVNALIKHLKYFCNVIIQAKDKYKKDKTMIKKQKQELKQSKINFKNQNNNNNDNEKNNNKKEKLLNKMERRNHKAFNNLIYGSMAKMEADLEVLNTFLSLSFLFLFVWFCFVFFFLFLCWFFDGCGFVLKMRVFEFF